eukprot:m.174549 g.174549  ORF g.174549 m.174549 type:complete len:438 (+) comp17900_c1_seq9:257-1570(+)
MPLRPSPGQPLDQRVWFALAGVIIFCVLLWSASRSPTSSVTVINKLPLQVKKQVDNCVGVALSVGTLSRGISLLASCPERPRELLKLLDRLFAIDTRSATLDLPPEFATKVKGWLNNDEQLFAEVYDQSITSVFNKITHESSVFNPLRARRPRPKQDNPMAYVNKLIEETQEGCDFCNYRKMTAVDTFGRFESEHVVTASNTFKYEKFHTLLMFRHHDPIHWTEPQFVDLVTVARKWFQRAYETNRDYVFPHVMWDCLPKASASQIHPHAQIDLAATRYYGLAEHLHQRASAYFNEHGRSYWTDLINVHYALGLAYLHKDVTVMAYLTPKKDNEIIVVAPTLSDDFARVLHHVLRIFIDDLQLQAFSMAWYLPRMDGKDGLPAVARVIHRGIASQPQSDISAMELFATSNVNTDPWAIAGQVFSRLPAALASGQAGA